MFVYLFNDEDSNDKKDIFFFENYVQKYFSLKPDSTHQQFQEYMKRNSKNIEDVEKYDHFQVFGILLRILCLLPC